MTGAFRLSGIPAEARTTTIRRTLELHVIARLGPECAVADLFSDEIFYCTTGLGEPSVRGWSDSVRTAPGSPVSLTSLDHALYARGYLRTSSWRPHVTAADVLRYFATAYAEIRETIR